MTDQKLRLFYFGPSKSIHVIRWLTAFIRMGHQVHLATTNVEAGRSIPGVIIHDINVHMAWPKLITFIWRWKKVRDILRAVRPDIVHGHCVSGVGAYPAYFRGYPLVMTAWGPEIPGGPNSFGLLQTCLTKWRLGRCDLITVCSEYLKQVVVALGTSPDQVITVQIGANVERIRSFRRSDYLRQIADVPQEAFVVLSTRWHEPKYNIDIVLKAIPKVLRATTKKVYFVFAGDGRLRSGFERLARGMGINNETRFIGTRAHEELEACYGGADAYVSIPKADSILVCLQEAMACGLPVVVSDAPDNLEWVQDGWNGYVVPRGDSDATAEAILRLIADEPACVEFGARSAKIAEEKADHITNMRKMEGLYLALAKPEHLAG